MRTLIFIILLVSFQNISAQSVQDSSIVYSHMQLQLNHDEGDLVIRKGDEIVVTYRLDNDEGESQELRANVSSIGKDYFMLANEEREGATRINHSEVLKIVILNPDGLTNRKNYGIAFMIVLFGTPVLAILAGALYSYLAVGAGLIVASILVFGAAQEKVETVVEMKVEGPEIISVPEDADYAWWMDYWEAKSKKKSL